MLKKHMKFNVLFAIIFLLQLLAEYNTELIRLKYTTKPLITLSLMLMLVVGTKLSGRFHKRVFAGLVFALAGDILLMKSSDPDFFIYGLAAFLICHLCYISAFYLDFRSAPELDKKGARIAILLCAIFSISFYFFIRPHLGTMKLPVLAYIFVMALTMMMAAFRNQRVNRSSFLLILTGAICFLVSDALLTYNKFVSQTNCAGLFIMATYMAAQYLITMGATARKLLNKS
ncbi:MAG TPA: lysoplasmalogenase [Pedobacter sp.]|nr:lysoplasmalogenase [Pedobacter sp.]